MTAVQRLKQEIEDLSEPLAQEVLDFLLSVRQKHETGWPPGLFGRTAGAWEGELLERAPQGDPEHT